MPGSVSNAESRTATMLGSTGLLEKRPEPQLVQKHFSKPPSGAHEPRY
jgi:hypothetical protein